MSRSRAQGTAQESHIVTQARAVGLVARRLAEGGRKDEGDVEIIDAAGVRHVVESKACERISLHAVWKRARLKVRGGDVVAVAWKRVTLKPGNSRRTADGPTLVVVPLDDWLALLQRVEA